MSPAEMEKRLSEAAKGNLLDRAIKAFDPVRGKARMQARMQMAAAESSTTAYVGASRTRRQLSSWKPLGGDADTDLMGELPTLRERSRDMIRNIPLATGAVGTVCTNAVGPGLKPQSRIDRDYLGMTEEDADAFERNVEREWKLFSSQCDYGRALNHGALQFLAFRSVLENGDSFVNMPYIKRPGDTYGLKLQLIEADRVSNPNRQRDTDTLVGGVEKDTTGAPVAYYVSKNHPGKAYGSTKGEWVKVDAFTNTGRRNMLHLYQMERIAQSRGIPYLTPVMETLKMLGKYTDGELMAAVISSYFTVILRDKDGNEMDPMKPETETKAKGTDEDFKLAPGAILSVGEGQGVDVVNPGRPNTAFDQFVMSMARQIGAGLHQPYEVLIKHFTASYSASRGALLEAWTFYKKMRHFLVTSFCQPTYEAFFYEAVANGRIIAPGFFNDPLIRQAYLGTEWIGPAMGQIDPLKEVNAAEKRLDIGMTTLSQETASYNGGDWDLNHPQQVKERKKRLEGGLISEKIPPTDINTNREPDNSSGSDSDREDGK